MNRAPETRESASREEILSALTAFTERRLDMQRLRAIDEKTTAATAALRYAARAILACVDAVTNHGGLKLSDAMQRIYAYSLAPDPVSEIYSIAHTSDPARPTFPTKSGDVYACQAILHAMQLADVTL